MLDPGLQAFRKTYRRQEVPPGYRWVLHLGFTFVSGFTVVVCALLQLHHVHGQQWLAVPLTFLYANFAEYLGHRFAMHRPVTGLKVLFARHVGQHHRFFSNSDMEVDSMRDLKVVLFPPALMIFFVLVFALPMGMLLAWVFDDNVGFLFVATAVAYFLNYEILHLSYHLPEGSWLGRRWLVRRLRGVHTRHHDPRLMGHCNFNITYPIADCIFNTFQGVKRPG